MQMPTDHAMTKNKYEELERELEKLKQKRPSAAKEVSRLAELGDFSENVEYQLAKGRLRGINSAILKLGYRISHAELIKSGKDGVVQLGSTVIIKTPKGEKTYTILGASEADPANGIISRQSPLGSALLGHKVGDLVEVERFGKCELVKIR